MGGMTRTAGLALGVAAVLLLQPAGLQAQRGDGERPVARGQALPPGDSERPPDANTTRDQLQNILYRTPPNVRTVLQADPALIERPDYLAPYPELAAFLEAHPEVARNPGFFLGFPNFVNRGPAPLEVFAMILAGVGLFLAFITVVTIIGSLVRQVVDYRRWLRQVRLQSEFHTKIFDRLTSNEDLLTYVQTPSGRQFLEFAPRPSGEAPPVYAPFGRILWSVQAGVVLAALGIGLRWAQASVPEEIVPAFSVLAVIVTALGVGAVVAALVAYLLSARFGLLPARRQETHG